ncbi:hypothetical protein CVT26_010321 [Gymnopilus dilepis]|uniref:Uncharacterized protein n=1 Tax=Gymnopilus dilepis TaxID=231916 RepID=A0A409Y0X6_9AGAR|nr:hypothetical protein CVT26_010321 [Gymnopilus dilepis]
MSYSGNSVVAAPPQGVTETPKTSCDGVQSALATREGMSAISSSADGLGMVSSTPAEGHNDVSSPEKTGPGSTGAPMDIDRESPSVSNNETGVPVTHTTLSSPGSTVDPSPSTNTEKSADNSTVASNVNICHTDQCLGSSSLDDTPPSQAAASPTLHEGSTSSSLSSPEDEAVIPAATTQISPISTSAGERAADNTSEHRLTAPPRLSVGELSGSASTPTLQDVPSSVHDHQATSSVAIDLTQVQSDETLAHTSSVVPNPGIVPEAARQSSPPNVQAQLVQVDFKTFSAAGYVNDEKTFEKLHAMSSNQKWAALLNLWAVFECRYRNNGSLPTKPRPPEIAWWMKNNRKLNRFPPIVKASDFILSWRQWWMAMQPDWRSRDPSWPPSRDAPEGSHWPKFTHSGPNGMFLLILSLGWWGRLVANGSGDVLEYETALDDVLWVLSRTLGGIPATPQKRGHIEEEELDDGDLAIRPRSKRSRKSV